MRWERRLEKENKRMFHLRSSACALFIMITAVNFPAAADSFFFSTGNPDGKIGTLSRPASPGKLETETADDFILTNATTINHASFIGLLPSGAPLSDVTDVEIELYHIFPADSANPPSGNVASRKK